MKILNELLYTADHEWVKIEGNKACVGITDYAQHSLGDVVFIELPEVESEFTKDETFGVIESVKAASDLCIPLSGKILEINEELGDNPEAVNEDAYANWMVVIEMTDKAEVSKLLSSVQYEELCGKED